MTSQCKENGDDDSVSICMYALTYVQDKLTFFLKKKVRMLNKLTVSTFITLKKTVFIYN